MWAQCDLFICDHCHKEAIAMPKHGEQKATTYPFPHTLTKQNGAWSINYSDWGARGSDNRGDVKHACSIVCAQAIAEGRPQLSRPPALPRGEITA